MKLPKADLRRSSLVDQAIAAVKRAIADGSLNSGDRLVQAQLAASLGLGTPIVREALIQLVNQGFLTRIPRKGTFVTNLTEEQIVEVY